MTVFCVEAPEHITKQEMHELLSGHNPYRMHVEPLKDSELVLAAQGCQWSRMCKDCVWPDCVIENLSDQVPFDQYNAAEYRGHQLPRPIAEDLRDLGVVNPDRLRRMLKAVVDCGG